MGFIWRYGGNDCYEEKYRGKEMLENSREVERSIEVVRFEEK